MKYWGSVAFLGLVFCQINAVAQKKSSVSAPANLSKSVYTGTVSRFPASKNTQTALSGTVQVGVKLSDPPLVVAVGANAKQNGIKMTAAQQQSYLAQLKQKQDAVMSQIRGL